MLLSCLSHSDQSFEVGRPSKPKGKVLKLPPDLEKKFAPQMMHQVGPPSRPMFPPPHAQQPPPAYYQYMRQVELSLLSPLTLNSPIVLSLLDAARSTWPANAPRHDVSSPLPTSPHATTLPRPPFPPHAGGTAQHVPWLPSAWSSLPPSLQVLRIIQHKF